MPGIVVRPSFLLRVITKPTWGNSGKFVYMVLMSIYPQACGPAPSLPTAAKAEWELQKLDLHPSQALSPWSRDQGESEGFCGLPRPQDKAPRTEADICGQIWVEGRERDSPDICWQWRANQGTCCFFKRINSFDWNGKRIDWTHWLFIRQCLPWREMVGKTTTYICHGEGVETATPFIVGGVLLCTRGRGPG